MWHYQSAFGSKPQSYACFLVNENQETCVRTILPGGKENEVRPYPDQQ